MSDQIAQIDLRNVETRDFKYRVSFSGGEPGYLPGSIQRIGLVSLPLLRQIGDRYLILSGFNRIQALQISGIQTFHAQVIDPDASEQDCQIKSICAAAFSKDLTQAELARCIGRLKNFWSIDKIAEASESVLNVSLKPKMINDLYRIYCLPDPALQVIHEGRLSFRTALSLCGMDLTSAQSLIRMFSQIKASTGKQNQILTWLTDIAARDQQSVQSLLEMSGFQTILSDPQTPENIKADQIRTSLYENRFPSIHQMRSDFHRAVSDLEMKGKIKISESENFEKPDLMVSFSARTPEEFRKLVSQLARAADSEQLDRIFRS